MALERVPVSISQFCELIGIAPGRLSGVEVDRASSRVTLVLEEDEMAQTSKTYPALTQGGKKTGGKTKGGRKGC